MYKINNPKFFQRNYNNNNKKNRFYYKDKTILTAFMFFLQFFWVRLRYENLEGD